MSVPTKEKEARWGTDASADKASAGADGKASKAGGKAGKKAKKKGSKKKKIILLVVLLLVGGMAYKMFFAPKKVLPPAAGDVVAMDATALNLADGHGLKIAVDIELVEGKATKDDFKASEAKQLVIDEFSNRSVASISSYAARKRLTEELEKKIKKAYDGEVFDIFITQFFAQ